MSSTRLSGFVIVFLLAASTAFTQELSKTLVAPPPPPPGSANSVSAIVNKELRQAPPAKTPAKAPKTGVSAKHAPTVAEAEAFMKKAEDQLEDISVRASRAGWVQENFITDD